ncbi:MAG: phosphate acyltransferase [Solirubrobacterales bacterium]|jgi:glycerol-3-phosphate acyltransferase PlsX|nr:phosphate acyltransferase [Solirubrobacterales bacterium]
MTTVALDGRGAERGADVVIAGVIAAAADGIGVRVFGDPGEYPELAELDGVELLEAPGRITNDDDPVGAVRGTPEASIVLAAADVAAGHSQALASPGPTGATMTAALFALKRMHGVRRPALAVQLVVPGRERPPSLLLDVGANTDVRPSDLVQFAYLGAAFSRAVLGIESPRVALLSVGEEPKKGTQTVVDAHAELAAAEEIDFRGNVEGRDLLADAADVIVTDGFTGNVALKTIEGTAKAVAGAVGDAARSNPLAAVGGLLMKPALGGLRRRLDPDTTGGAILLGLRGVAVVGHGSSGPEGIANAIRLAARAVEVGAIERTGELLERSGTTRAAMRDRKEAQ